MRNAIIGTGAVLAVLAMFFASAGWLTLSPLLSARTIDVPAILVIGTGAASGALLAIGLMMDRGDVESIRRPVGALILILGVMSLGVLMILAATGPDPAEPALSPSSAGIVFVCGTLAMLAAVGAIESLTGGHPVQFETSWGGLGGGLGGWRISSTTALTILAVIFASATVTIGALEGVNPNANDSNTADGNEGQPADPATENEGAAPANESSAAETNGENAAAANPTGNGQ